MADISKITAGGTTYNVKDANASRSNHTHTTSIAASSGTSQISLSANTKYSITAGGTSYIFTTPAHQDISGKADKANITAGTAGTSSATSGSTLAVPYVTMNAQGIVTGYGTHTHTITGFSTTDTKTTVGSSTTTNKLYFVGVQTSGGTYQTSYVDTGVYSTDGHLKCDRLYLAGDQVYMSYNSTTGAIEFNN